MTGHMTGHMTSHMLTTGVEVLMGPWSVGVAKGCGHVQGRETDVWQRMSTKQYRSASNMQCQLPYDDPPHKPPHQPSLPPLLFAQ